jgi:hypothetical protein
VQVTPSDGTLVAPSNPARSGPGRRDRPTPTSVRHAPPSTTAVPRAHHSNGGRWRRDVRPSLQESNELLEDLRNRTALAVVAVTAVAALAGWLIARQVTRRRAADRVAEEVASTGRLDVDVPVDGHDEAGRLGVASTRCSAPWPGRRMPSSAWR